MIQHVLRLLGCTALTAAVVLAARPAQAQFHPRATSDPAAGEQFHIEASASWWRPNADITVSSESLGIAGSDINFKDDLGLQDKGAPALQLTLRPARRHKLRFQYIPLTYDNSSTLERGVVFNGQRYPAGATVTSTFDWKAYFLGYEYDVLTLDRGFGGVIVDFKYTDVRTQLTAPVRGATIDEFAQARAPIPTLGGIGRIYVVPTVSITAEITGFKIPTSIDSRYQAHYLDADIYGTVNVNRFVGAKVGYRLLDLGYAIKSDSGSFTEKGIYFGVVARY